MVACHSSLSLVLADQAGHGTPGRLRHREVMPVRVTPHHPLRAGGLQLPVDGEQFARRGKDQVGIVQRGVDGVPLGHADTHVGPSLPGGPAQDLCLRPRHQDGVVVVQPPVLPARGGPAAHGEAESHAVGIAGDEQLREHDQLRLLRSRGPDQLHRLHGAGGFVKHHWGGLDHRDPAGLPQIPHT